jgi:alkylation response protein AidB-like acyl-CoA dehydrogenase
MTDDASLDDLREALRDFLSAKSGEEDVRKLMASEPTFDPAVWTQLADQMRLPGLAIPEEYGGDGFGLVELGVVMEEMGRVLLCAPYFSTVVLAAHALLLADDKDACARYLPDVAAGRTTATLAVAEHDGSWHAARATTEASERDGGWTLTGQKSFVLDGTTADVLLVVARTAAGPTLFAVDRADPGVRCRPMTTLDGTRAQAVVDLAEARAVLIGQPGHAGRLVAGVLDVAAVALAAEQSGGARRCLEESAEYARTRYQFGRPIGSFQAVKHKCADMLADVALAEAAAREAARLHDIGDRGFPAAAVAAHVFCSRAYLAVAMENIQVHGGIGFTWEHSAHLYFRRAKSSQLLLGGPAVYHERLLDRLGI